MLLLQPSAIPGTRFYQEIYDVIICRVFKLKSTSTLPEQWAISPSPEMQFSACGSRPGVAFLWMTSATSARPMSVNDVVPCVPSVDNLAGRITTAASQFQNRNTTSPGCAAEHTSPMTYPVPKQIRDPEPPTLSPTSSVFSAP